MRCILSPELCRHVGHDEVHARHHRPGHASNRALLPRQIEQGGAKGAALHELVQVLPALSRDQVRTLPKEFKSEGLVQVQGLPRAGRWFAAMGWRAGRKPITGRSRPKLPPEPSEKEDDDDEQSQQA